MSSAHNLLLSGLVASFDWRTYSSAVAFAFTILSVRSITSVLVFTSKVACLNASFNLTSFFVSLSPIFSIVRCILLLTGFCCAVSSIFANKFEHPSLASAFSALLNWLFVIVAFISFPPLYCFFLACKLYLNVALELFFRVRARE